MQQKILLSKQSREQSIDVKDAISRSRDLSSFLGIKRPQTARIKSISKINYGDNPSNNYYELDTDGYENIFNISTEIRDSKMREIKKSINVEKILYNLNYFPNKPTLLTTGPVSKEDPSWGTGNPNSNQLVNQTEEKGHYEHLSLFLEDTILQRREQTITAVVPYARNETGKNYYLSLEEIVNHREQGINTVE